MKKKGQIWIETVIYTLIIMTIMGVVLGIVKPTIDEKKDQSIVTQSIDILNNIDEKVDEVKYAPGNSRELGIKITKGKLVIDSINSRIIMLIENSKYQYGEIGQKISEGNIIIETGKIGKLFMINLTLDYSGKFNITYREEKDMHTIQPSPSVEKIIITNMGRPYYPYDNSTYIDFS